EVVGVVEHVKIDGPRKESKPQIYKPYMSGALFDMSFTVRSKAEQVKLGATIRKEVEVLGGGRPVHSIKPMSEYVSEAMADSRFALFLLGVLAFVALALCSVGLYGVISYSVSQRMVEIGIRMALGAQSGDILKMIIGKGLALTLVGVAIGLAGSFALTRLMT